MDNEGQAEVPVATQLPTSPGSIGKSPILLDTVFLLGLRVVFFLLARSFLLSNLNATLRHLSKTENALPLPAQSSVDRPSVDSRATSIIPGSEFELDDDEDEDRQSVGSPSSYPNSPIRTPEPMSGSSREAYARRGTDDEYFAPKLPGNNGYAALPTMPNSSGGIELENLGRKLKNVGKEASQTLSVLNLSHGKRKQDASMTASKQATRELSRLSRTLFSLCFAEGCNLLVVVIFHALGILHARSRQINFSISLHVLLAMVLLIIPLVQCLLFTYRARGSSARAASRGSSLSVTARLLIALIPFALYVFLFSLIPPYVTAMSGEAPDPVASPPVPNAEDTPIPTSGDSALDKWSSGPEGWEGSGWLASSLGRVIVLGVVVLGGLSGFGAVRTAWNFIEYALGSASHALTDSDVLQAERSLYRVRHETISRREELSRAIATGAVSPSGRGWVGRVFGTKGGQEAASIEAELAGLRAIERQVSRSVNAMKLRKRRQEFSHTLRGKIYNIIGYVFAAYCAARLLMCLPSLSLSTSRIPLEDGNDLPHGKGNTNGDWISFLLALAISHLPTGVADIDVAIWSRAISLLLTGVLILSSLTQVLRSLSRILRLTSKTAGAGFLLLSLGQLFSTYVISLLVQLRSALPPAPVSEADPFSPVYSNSTSVEPTTSPAQPASNSLLATLPDFRVFGRLFDVVFLIVAVGTATYRYIALKVNSAEDSGEIYRSST